MTSRHLTRIVIQNVDFIPTTALRNYAYEAVSLIMTNIGVVFPEIPFSLDNRQIVNFPFLFNFSTNQRLSDVNIISNGMYPYRITAATDLDKHGDFWLLSLNRREEPPYNNETHNFSTPGTPHTK